MSNPVKKRQNGYTLSEILIALAILGVCFSLAVPMMAQSREKAQKKAIFKETLLSLTSILHEGMASDELKSNNDADYFLARLNAVKVCTGNSTLEGCWPQTGIGGPGPGMENNFAGAVLHNGATIAGFQNCCDGTNGAWFDGIAIDWNGPKPPNVDGDDQMRLNMSFGTTTWVNGAGVSYPPGRIVPYDANPNSIILYNEIFK